MVIVYTKESTVVYYHGDLIDKSDLVDGTLGIKIPLDKVFY
jgi:hypothetical protein